MIAQKVSLMNKGDYIMIYTNNLSFENPNPHNRIWWKALNFPEYQVPAFDVKTLQCVDVYLDGKQIGFVDDYYLLEANYDIERNVAVGIWFNDVCAFDDFARSDYILLYKDCKTIELVLLQDSNLKKAFPNYVEVEPDNFMVLHNFSSGHFHAYKQDDCYVMDLLSITNKDVKAIFMKRFGLDTYLKADTMFDLMDKLYHKFLEKK